MENINEMNYKNTPIVTIGIPFYNDEKYLDLAIKSVLKQSYTDWRLLLISDGGTDNSLSIAQKYENDPRVTLFYDGENKKLPYRLNQLSSMVKTEYYARMDADDIMHPKRIETQLKILESNPNIDVLGTNVYSIDESNVIKGVRMNMNDGEYSLKKCTGFIHPSIMGKTEWFKNNPYDEKAIRAEDFELWQRTKQHSTFKVWTEPLLFYREFGSNYYKKYYDSIKSKYYIAKKLKTRSAYLNAFKTPIIGSIYYLFSLVGSEDVLLRIRYTKLNNIDLKNAFVYLNDINDKNNSNV